MLRRLILCSFLLLAAGIALPATSAFARQAAVMLPNGWVIDPPQGLEARTGTMPQGMAPSPDGATIAVVESGYRPAALGLYRASDLTRIASIPLAGAFGRPLWRDASHVLVPGANADALLDVDVATGTVRAIPFPKGSTPAYVAASPDGHTYAVATDGDTSVRIGTLETIAGSAPVAIGGHPGGIAFASDGRTVIAANRSGSDVVIIDTATRELAHHDAGLHPSAIAVTDGRVYVAASDADAVAVFDARDFHLLHRIPVGDANAKLDVRGVSPNALSAADGAVFVSLGAANSIAVIRNDAVAERVPAGWYPTDVFAAGSRLYILDGKGEGAPPNPRYRNRIKDDSSYVAALEYGSLRTYDLRAGGEPSGNPQGSQGWSSASASAIVRPNGPIRHVFFVLKENRSYDQVLGDMPQGNGDASLAWFGAKITPNEHAIAARFGLFDNTYASGEVSAAGHMWAQTAFANDYVERYWPPGYGGRRPDDDNYDGGAPGVPGAGYLWDAARRAHVTFRDYGELVNPPAVPGGPWSAGVPSLNGVVDTRYAGWDLDYSDLDRVREWRRDFNELLAAGKLPQFEFIWLPNDHTYGAKAGKLTPDAYVATNDYAVGQMADTLSHSKAWASSAMFVMEDDAQDGPDHVSDQRTTLYLVSPYARGGVRHEHYATVSVLRTIEIMLGMQPLSTYDAMAVPMYAAFGRADMRSFDAIPPEIDITQRNGAAAYGAKLSAKLNFSKPDAIPGRVMERILSRNH